MLVGTKGQEGRRGERERTGQACRDGAGGERSGSQEGTGVRGQAKALFILFQGLAWFFLAVDLLSERVGEV